MTYLHIMRLVLERIRAICIAPKPKSCCWQFSTLTKMCHVASSRDSIGTIRSDDGTVLGPPPSEHDVEAAKATLAHLQVTRVTDPSIEPIDGTD